MGSILKEKYEKGEIITLALTPELLCVCMDAVYVNIPVYCPWNQSRASGVLCHSLSYCIETDFPTKPETLPLADWSVRSK